MNTPICVKQPHSVWAVACQMFQTPTILQPYFYCFVNFFGNILEMGLIMGGGGGAIQNLGYFSLILFNKASFEHPSLFTYDYFENILFPRVKGRTHREYRRKLSSK